MGKRRIALILLLLVIISAMVFLAQARGSWGFTSGSVVADGSFSGKYDNKAGFVQLMISPLEGDAITGVVFCVNPGQGQGGNVPQGVNPVDLFATFSSAQVPLAAESEHVSREKGSVTITDLVAGLSRETLTAIFQDQINDLCPGGNQQQTTNWEIIDFVAVGFFARVDVVGGDGEIDQRFEYRCGVTRDQLESGMSPFEPPSDIFTLQYGERRQYRCVETLDTTNP